MHRSRREQSLLVKAVLNGTAEAAFFEARLTPDEEAWCRHTADRVIADVVDRRAALRRYERIAIKRPALKTTLPSALVAVATAIAAAVLFDRVDLDASNTYPMLTASIAMLAIAFAAMGWGVSAWTAHRNARARYTLDMISKRYAAGEFTAAMEHFNRLASQGAFDAVAIDRLRNAAEQDGRMAAQAVHYLLNYFEFLAVGVIEGELDERIVRRTLRGNINYVHDAAAAYIYDLQANNPKTLEHLTALRRHYREL